MRLDVETLRGTLSVADGAWSTQLRMRGLPPAAPAENANLTHPQLVTNLSRMYVAAGARFITTNTFAAGSYALERFQLTDKVHEINLRGAQLARDAVGEVAVVAGSIGPSGKILAVQEISEDELVASVKARTTALVEGGVDAILLETFSEVAETLIALKTVKDETDLPVICSMSFDSGPQRTRTMMGAQASECAAALEDGGADVIGCNCGAATEQALPAVVALRAATDLPLWVKPSAGLPELQDGLPVWTQTPEEFVAHVPALIEAGANILGGCCGSGPDHIRRLAAIVARSRPPA